jgi:glycine/D-amino acid oxidase-like deaminating enzyme
MAADIFHRDFKAAPWWWEWWQPSNALSQDPPRRVDVAIVGAGYGGLSTALELRRGGSEVVVLERGDFGTGASSRNGGMISGGVNLGKGISGTSGDQGDWAARKKALLASGVDSMAAIEDIIEREGLQAHYIRHGRFMGAFTPAHYDDLAAKVADFNALADAGASMLPRERQREAIASDYYHGGMLVERAGHLHPACYYGSLLAAAHKAGAILCARTEAVAYERKTAGGYVVKTNRGDIEATEVVVATNGYTGDVTPWLKRRLVPVASHIIATEELPDGMAEALIPRSRAIADTKRVLTYYRLSPDGKRLIFGGRARFTQAPPEVSAPVLHRYMTDRFPQLKGTKITHAWAGNVAFAFDWLPHMGRTPDGLRYLMACNGNGVAMMTYLGRETARKILGGSNAPANAFDSGDFPTRRLYNGDPSWALPMVGAWYRFRDWWDRRAA